jgi:hypothetical protein
VEQKILRASTQTLVTYPRLAPQRLLLEAPTSATVKLLMPAVQGTTYDPATVDTLSATTLGAHQEGDDHVTLSASVALVANRRYLLEPGNGRHLDVRALEGGTTNQLRTAEPLPCTVRNGSALKGWAVTVALTAAQTDQVGDALALFRAVINGSTYEWSESFRVVNRITSPRLNPTMLTHAYPILASLRDTNDIDYEETIQAAWEHRIVPALAAKGILDEDVISDEALIPWHATACVLHLIEPDPRFATDFVSRMRELHEQQQQTTLARADFAVRSQDESTPRDTGNERRFDTMRISR